MVLAGLDVHVDAVPFLYELWDLDLDAVFQGRVFIIFGVFDARAGRRNLEDDRRRVVNLKGLSLEELDIDLVVLFEKAG